MDTLLTLPARLPDWRARLGHYVAAVAARPFRPGAHDCALFVAGAVEAMTGADAAAEWRGTYRTLAAGIEALQAAGFADHVAFVAAHCAAVVPAFAAVGDLAVVPGDGGAHALGIVQGGGVYCLRPGGLAVVSRLHIQKAFRV